MHQNGTTTHVAVFLASVARLDGRLGAVHVLRDGIRRNQTVPACSAYEISTTDVCVLRMGGRTGPYGSARRSGNT